MSRTYPPFDGRNNRNGLRVFLGLAVLAGFLWFIWVVLVPESYRDKWDYSDKYHLSDGHVHFSPKPKDCDWNHAPIETRPVTTRSFFGPWLRSSGT